MTYIAPSLSTTTVPLKMAGTSSSSRKARVLGKLSIKPRNRHGKTRKTRITKKHSFGAGTRKARVPTKHCFGAGITTTASSSLVEGIGIPSLEPQQQPVNISNSQEIPPPVYTKEEFDRLAYLASITPYSLKAELDCQPHTNCLCCQHVFGDFRYYTKEEEDVFPIDD